MEKITFLAATALFSAVTSCVCPYDLIPDEPEDSYTNLRTTLHESVDAQLSGAQIETTNGTMVQIKSGDTYNIYKRARILGSIRVANSGEIVRKIVLEIFEDGLKTNQIFIKPNGHLGAEYHFRAKACPGNKNQYTVSKAVLTVTTSKRVSAINIPGPFYINVY